jgi:hypothetical protein
MTALGNILLVVASILKDGMGMIFHALLLVCAIITIIFGPIAVGLVLLIGWGIYWLYSEWLMHLPTGGKKTGYHP